jgi:hypothetical protein
MLIDAGTQDLSLQAGQLVEISGVSGPAAIGVTNPAFTTIASPGLPPATRASIDQLQSGAFTSREVETEGIVRSAYERDDSLELKVAAGSRSINVDILDYRYLPDPASLVDCKIRLSGVCRFIPAQYQEASRVQIQVPGLDQVTVDEPAANPASIPLRTIAELARVSAAEVPAHRVRVAGIVMEQKLGKLLVIHDGNDALKLESSQMTPLPAGSRVEALGFLVAVGASPKIDDASFREVGLSASSATEGLATHSAGLSRSGFLATVKQVRNLTSEEASQSCPVRIKGVVTFCDTRSFMLFVQDSTGGVFVNCSPAHPAVRPGQMVEIEGTTNPGHFAPYIEAREVRVFMIPQCRFPSVRQLRALYQAAWTASGSS